MRLLLTLCFLAYGSLAMGQEIATRARQLEEKGQAGAARTLLLAAAKEAPNDALTLTVAAEFLDRHGDPAARATYEKLVARWPVEERFRCRKPSWAPNTPRSIFRGRSARFRGWRR
jgi:hypothetical protein